jgi:hypothetical protein
MSKIKNSHSSLKVACIATIMANWASACEVAFAKVGSDTKMPFLFETAFAKEFWLSFGIQVSRCS